MNEIRLHSLASLVRCLGAAVLLGVAVAGCGGGDAGGDTSSGATKPAAGDAAAGAEEGPKTAGTGGGGGGGAGYIAPPSGGAGMMGGMGMGGGASETPVAGGAPKVTSRPSSTRQDPFKPWWNAVTPPPPAIELIQPDIRRIATRESVVAPGVSVDVQEVAQYRVAGIATGTGVYALLEGQGAMTIVRPGDEIGGYRVASINGDSVTLKRSIGNNTYTQVVPLTSAGSTTTVGGPGVGRGGPMGGMMGGPGMGRPGGGGGNRFGDMGAD